MIYFVPYTCYSGLGLDDMFVIVQCWTDIKKDPNMVGLSIADTMGIALKQAAVLVTVSCIAELFVLGVGALTVSMNIITLNLPVLYFSLDQSFIMTRIFLIHAGWLVVRRKK